MNNTASREIIGLIPAAGNATRIAPLPCSKELYPLGFRVTDDSGKVRPKVVSHYLLENMRLADITKAYIILRDGKWDIPSYYADGKLVDMQLAYLMMDLPYGVPYTLDQAYPFVKDSIVALGFPDMIVKPYNCFSQLIAKLNESMADVILGVFPVDKPHKTDMVELNENGRILSIQVKPAQTELLYTWEIAVWTPAFTRFMHDYISSGPGADNSESPTNDKKITELFVGDVVHAAIKNSMYIDSVIFKEGSYLDIGTPDDLHRAVRMEQENLGKLSRT